MTQSASDSYRNTLRYQGQDYRFAPTYIRKRDPISPTNQSPDIKPPEQQGYYPVTSLWTNIVDNRIWMLVNIQNNLANWILIAAGGGGGIQSLTTPNVTVFPSGAGDISFASADGSVAIVGNAGTFSIDLSAAPVLNLLDFHLVQKNMDVFPLNSVVNFDSADTTVTITRTNGNTIDFSVPGAANTFHGLRAATNATNVDPDPAAGVLQNRILIASASNSVVVNGNAGTHTVDLNVPGAINQFLVDRKSDGTADGTVNPVLNTVRIQGYTPTLGTQGILTSSETNTFANDTVYIRYVQGFATTIGNTSAIIQTIALTNDSSMTIQAVFDAVSVPGGDCFGGRLLVVANNKAGVVSVAAELENLSMGTGLLNACFVTAQAVAGGVQFIVVGVPGQTIRWHAIFPNISSQV